MYHVSRAPITSKIAARCQIRLWRVINTIRCFIPHLNPVITFSWFTHFCRKIFSLLIYAFILGWKVDSINVFAFSMYELKWSGNHFFFKNYGIIWEFVPNGGSPPRKVAILERIFKQVFVQWGWGVDVVDVVVVIPNGSRSSIIYNECKVDVGPYCLSR